MSKRIRVGRQRGFVYVIHFDAPLFHARHYVGWTANLAERIKAHAEGRGSPLLRAVTQAVIRWRVVRVFKGGRDLERHIKNYHGAARVCPYCTVDVRGEAVEEVPVPAGMVCEPPRPEIVTDIPW